MEGNDKPAQKDFYKILEVDYDATAEKIRLNYRMLALKWHPDKHTGDSAVTEKFQEINEAYTVLSDPAKRLEYDSTGIYEIDKYTLGEYLARFKGMILTCNGLGISHASTWYYNDEHKAYCQYPFIFTPTTNLRMRQMEGIHYEICLRWTQRLMETNDFADK